MGTCAVAFFLACSLDQHPLISDINDMLSKDLSYSAIWRFITEELPERPYELDSFKPVISRHRNHCLGMAPKGTNKPKVEPEIETPPLEEILDETLRILYGRLKNDPTSVKTPEAIQLLGHLIRRIEVNSKKTDLGARLAQINDGSASEQN